MGKMFCFNVFGRKMRENKLRLDKEPVRQSKDAFDSCRMAEKTLVKNLGEAAVGIHVQDSRSTHPKTPTPVPKDASTEPKPCTSSKMQAISSGETKLDVNLVHNESKNVMKTAEICEILSDSSACSLHSQKVCMSEMALESAYEGTSRSDVESQGLHITKSCPDLQREGADASEDSLGGLDSPSNPPSCEDFSRAIGEITSGDTRSPERFGSVEQFTPFSLCHSVDVVDRQINEITVSPELEVVVRGEGLWYSPDAAVFLHNKDDRALTDDEILTGHLSDPGIYDKGERQLKLKSSNLVNNGTISYLDRGASLLKKSESDPYICESEGNVENISADVGEPASSPTQLTFCSADKVMLKSESSSKVLDSTKRNSWWKFFMASHRNIHLEGLKQSSQEVAFGDEPEKKLSNFVTGYTSDLCDNGRNSEYEDENRDALRAIESAHLGQKFFAGNCSEHEQEDVPGMGVQVSFGKTNWPSKEWIAFSTAESGLSRVEAWVRSIQQSDALSEEEVGLENNINGEEAGAVPSTVQKIVGPVNIDAELANAAIRSLNPFSTAAHIAGIGLREVPSLGLFNSLKTINLSANKIDRVPAGCLPRSLHVLDLSRNRIGVIEGFRELARLRVLNLSYNRISRIGHGLANCTLIKELYLAGNKLAEVEGLHRLLKLSILDLSFNKLTTSKALGQLAANYSSLLALNLLGNPVHMNIGEEQLRKLVVSITPHVIYLNKQPIKGVSAREAVVDSVARAALGSSQRNRSSSGTRVSRRLAEARSTQQQPKSYSRRSKDVERRLGSVAPESEYLNPARLPTPHHHHHRRHHNHNHGLAEKGVGKEYRHPSRAPMSVHEHVLHKVAMDTEVTGLHRSRSESALQD